MSTGELQTNRSDKASDAKDHLVNVLLSDESPRLSEGQLNLVQLWRIVWAGKWVVLGVTALFSIGAVANAMLATEWYRAEVLLAPAEEMSAQGLTAQFGGLASLAGIQVGGGGSAEPIAVLKSREFATDFIRELDLLSVLLADQWDAETQRWRSKDPEAWPDVRDAVKLFDEKVRYVSEDAKTGLVTIGIQWTDPDLASEWANVLVKRLNDRMRQRALSQAEANVAYLQNEMSGTNVVAIQQSIGRLLESELQKLMLARGNAEFAFRVIDSAEPPKYRYRPKRTLIVILGTFLGGIVAVGIVLVRNALLRHAAELSVREGSRVGGAR